MIIYNCCNFWSQATGVNPMGGMDAAWLYPFYIYIFIFIYVYIYIYIYTYLFISLSHPSVCFFCRRLCSWAEWTWRGSTRYVYIYLCMYVCIYILIYKPSVISGFRRLCLWAAWNICIYIDIDRKIHR